MGRHKNSAYFKAVELIMKEGENGNRCLTIKEIFKSIPIGKRPVTLQEIQVFLRKVRICLEEEFGIPACTISQAMYETHYNTVGEEIRSSYLIKPPKIRKEAEACIPYICSRPIAGILIPQKEKHCLIYQRYIEVLTDRFLGYSGSLSKKIERAGSQKIISLDPAKRRYRNSVQTNFSEPINEIVQGIQDEMKDMKTDLETKLNEILKKLSDHNKGEEQCKTN